MRGRVTVRLKDGVLDVEGKAIGQALGSLGFGAPEVRLGRIFEVELGDAVADPEAARAALTEMARRLLANPVMEVFAVEVDAPAAAAPAGPPPGRP